MGSSFGSCPNSPRANSICLELLGIGFHSIVCFVPVKGTKGILTVTSK